MHSGYFTWPGVINFDIESTPHGHFNDPLYPASQFPGIPGTTAEFQDDEHFAMELYTALEFTSPGLYTMVVNSDDDFATFTGLNPLDVFSASTLGSFDDAGGRGAADTSFQFYVQQPGVYGFRTIYEQGAGGANLEWFMVNPDGTRVLINDTTNSISAYQWLPTINAAYVRSITPADDSDEANPDLVQAVIVDGSTPIATSSVSLQIDNAPVTGQVTKTGSEITVTYRPNPLLPSESSHTAKLTWTEGGNTVTREWQFTVAPYTKDLVNNYFGTLVGEAEFTANSGGRTGTNGDHAIFFGAVSGGGVLIPHAGDYMNPPATNDEMTVSLWQKRVDLTDSAIMWAYSASGSDRPWGVHLPWSDNVVYFDTGGGQRISRSITEYPEYTVGWWTNWHHFVFTKQGGVKQVWIDGDLHVEGAEAAPLVTDFSHVYLGQIAPGNAPTRGWIDDYAVYAKALSASEIATLAGGAAPNSLPAATELVAYWNFNDAPVETAKPTISMTRNGAIVSITYTGRLQSSTTVNGQYNDVPGATNPYTVNTTQGQAMFFRSVQ